MVVSVGQVYSSRDDVAVLSKGMGRRIIATTTTIELQKFERGGGTWILTL